ncbi:MAG TPA: GNAT family N-acetyltransferase [Candidatus Dormibacteraeota bacterium]|nr:GNAT family N-acetyltransferase [Candidatus Dormibacteraeota bacterium]
MSSRAAALAASLSTGLTREATHDVQVVSGLEALRALEADWRRLAAATNGGNPFLAWEWTITWAEVMMAGHLETAVVRDGGEVVAIAPFYRNRYSIGPGVKATSLQLYGPRELQTIFELRQIPMRPGQEAGIVRQLLRGLAETARWDWIEVGEYGPRVECWREVMDAIPEGVRLVVEDRYAVPILPLRTDWEAQRSALRRNVKERIRRGYNTLKREGIEFELEVDSEPAHSGARLDEFHRLHERRALMTEHKEHGNSFRHPRLRAFLAKAVPRMVEAGVLRFAALRSRGEVVATRLVFESDASLYLYYSGFEPDWWDRSVMTVLVTELVKSAIARGVKSVNFSPGLDQFKSGWTEPEFNAPISTFMFGRTTAASRVRLDAFRRRKRASSAVASGIHRIRLRLGRAR